MSEDQIQAAAYKLAYNTYPAIRGLLFSIPNGSSRDIREATKLKATGCTPGAPDLMLLWAGRAYGFEFKTAIGKLSEVQSKLHAVWIANGIPVYVIRSVEQFMQHVKEIIS